MKKLLTGILITLSILLTARGCSPDTADNLPSLRKIIGGILEYGAPADGELFSSTISCLVEGDAAGYASGISRLDSRIKPGLSAELQGKLNI